MSKRKIFMCVEGAKTDTRFMRDLLATYKIDEDYEIVSYNTNIYVLYQEMFANRDSETLDLLLILKAHETDDKRKKIFDEQYTDILLIFDMDPQDSLFSFEKLMEMQQYFNESTDNGKLYVNYPMIEGFFHIEEVPDHKYNARFATLKELKEGQYKSRVDSESIGRHFFKYRSSCNVIIRQNIDKAWDMLNLPSNNGFPDFNNILSEQEKFMKESELIAVLCTCVSFITEYNPQLICSDE